MSSPSAWTLSCCTGISLLVGASAMLTPGPRQETKTAAAAANKAAGGPAKAAPQRIDLSKAIDVDVPAASRDLEAVSFGTPDGKNGWVLRLPRGGPRATPGPAGGELFVRGGVRPL